MERYGLECRDGFDIHALEWVLFWWWNDFLVEIDKLLIDNYFNVLGVIPEKNHINVTCVANTSFKSLAWGSISGGYTVNQLLKSIIRQSVDQSVCQSISQLINQFVSQSASQPVRQSVSQSISQWIDQSVSQSVSESINQLVRQSVNVSISASFTKPVIWSSPWLFFSL